MSSENLKDTHTQRNKKREIRRKREWGERERDREGREREKERISSSQKQAGEQQAGEKMGHWTCKYKMVKG